MKSKSMEGDEEQEDIEEVLHDTELSQLFSEEDEVVFLLI